MPSLKAIRTRIQSVKNTQKITRALKLVAAARLRRAQDNVTAARPYAVALEDVIAEVAARAGDDAHPLLATRTMKKVELVVLTSDRGLAGAFNSNINRATERYVAEHREDFAEVGLAVIGKKGRDYLRRRRHNVTSELGFPTSATALAEAREITHKVIERYRDAKLDGVFLVYNEFKSAMSQRVVSERLLPIAPAATDGDLAQTDFLYEPGKKELLNQLLPLYVQSQIYRALLESIASEFGARMTSMDNATTNASEIIDRLTLQYNRARQAAITKELMEIVGGAEALKG